MSISNENCGYQDPQVAFMWNLHITEAQDPFRLNSGGLYEIIESWVKEQQLGEENSLIDVCCGQGITSAVASKSGCRVVGVDISQPLIQIAQNQYVRNRLLKFQAGNAADLTEFKDGEFDAGMMINGIFHLRPDIMMRAVAELSRVSSGPLLITHVNPEGYDFFAGAFANQTRFVISHPGYSDTQGLIGDPSIMGPNGSTITLRGTPFIMHPLENLKRAFDEAGLEIEVYRTWGPVSDVGGPKGLNLFVAIHLEHQR
jgi:SAM-dependent methyltransferase